jgi:hypothetical protein
MPAVTFDAAVARSSGFAPIANPIPTLDGASIVPAESVAVAPAPSVFPANSLPGELPPFPLNHPRILYDNLLLGSSVGESVGIYGERTLIPNTADRWLFNGNGYVEFTLPGETDIDTIGIGAHNLKGCTVTATYNADIAFDSVVAANNIAIMFHLPASVAVSAVKITISNNSGTERFIGSIYAGIALQMQRPYFGGSSPINLNRVTKFYSSRTETGNVIGREIRSENFKTDVDFKNLTNDWYRAYFDPFVESARRYPYFYAWNLEAYSGDVGYVETTEDIGPSYQGQRDLMSVGFSLLGVG